MVSGRGGVVSKSGKGLGRVVWEGVVGLGDRVKVLRFVKWSRFVLWRMRKFVGEGERDGFMRGFRRRLKDGRDWERIRRKGRELKW